MVHGGQRGPLGVGLTLLMAMLAGCASEGEPESLDDKGTIKSDIVDDDAPIEEGAKTGRVTGVVLHASGLPLADARVTVMSIETSAVTGANGTFSFRPVAAGDQFLRVEKANYQTLQQPFQVVAGKLTKLEVVLVPPGGADGGFAEHFHNHWRGQTKYELFKGTQKLDGEVDQVPPQSCMVTYSQSCYAMYFQLPEGRIVPPGTTKITVNLSFEPGPLFSGPSTPAGPVSEMMYFYMYGPPDAEGQRSYLYKQLTSGDERIEYELASPYHTDHGHARWTNWIFYIYWSSANHYASGSLYNALLKSPVDVEIVAHKGALPLDPPHARYWQDGERLEMATSDPSYIYCSTVEQYSCGARTPNPSAYGNDQNTWCYYACMVPGPGSIVAPGTTRLQFAIESYWGSSPYAPQAAPLFEQPDFVFGYKTAAVAPGQATWADYTWLEPIETYDGERGTVQTFEVLVGEDQEDPYYTRLSSWVFMTGLRGHEEDNTWAALECGYEACGYPYFELLELTAFNDNLETA